MSPAPRKPAKPKTPASRRAAKPAKAAETPATPVPKAPRAATPKKLDAIERALGDAGKTPAPDVAIRFDGKPPSARALKQLGVTDARAAELAKHLASRADEITSRLRDDRELAALFADDPAAALAKLDVPEKLRATDEDGTRAEFLERFRGVRVELPASGLKPGAAIPNDPATQTKLALLAATFARAAADPTAAAALRTDPLPVVKDVAASISPGGLGPSSSAAASVVTEVCASISAVYGQTQVLRIDPGNVVRIPRPGRGL